MTDLMGSDPRKLHAAWVKEQEDHAAWVTAGKPVPIIGGDHQTLGRVEFHSGDIPDHSDRLQSLERAVFSTKHAWPNGHDSLQAQLDELYAWYGELKLASTAHKDMGEGFTHHDEGCGCQKGVSKSPEDVSSDAKQRAKALKEWPVGKSLGLGPTPFAYADWVITHGRTIVKALSDPPDAAAGNVTVRGCDLRILLDAVERDPASLVGMKRRTAAEIIYNLRAALADAAPQEPNND